MSFLGGLIAAVKQAQGVEDSATSIFRSIHDSPTNRFFGVPPDRGINLQLSSYETVAAIYRAVYILSNSLAQVPLEFVDITDPDNPVVLNNSLEYQVFTNYNDHMTGYDFWEATWTYLHLTGEAPWLKGYTNGKLTSLYPMNPAHLSVVPGNRFLVDHYVYQKLNGDRIKIPADQIQWNKFFNPNDPLRGLSPLKAAEDEIILDVAAIESSKRTYKNGARPGGIMSTDEDLADIGEEEFKRFVAEYRAMYEGEGNVGKTAFLTNKWKFTQTAFSPDDLQYIEQRNFTIKTISRVYGVPPIMMMDFKEASVLANADVQHQLFWEGLIPRPIKFGQTLTKFIVPELTKNPNIVARFNISGIAALKDDNDAKYQRAKELIPLSAMTPNQARIEGGFEPDPNPALDKFYITSNLMPIDATGDTPEPAKGWDKIIEETNIMAYGELGSAINYVDEINAISEKRELEIRKTKGISSLLRIERQEGNKFRRTLSKLFNDQWKDLEQSINKLKESPAYLTKGMDGLEEKDLIDDVGFSFTKWAKIFKDEGEPHIAASLERAAEDLANDEGVNYVIGNPRSAEYIGIESTEYASVVNQTTKVDVDGIISKGLAAGDSLDDISKAIESYMIQTAAKSRAMMIARTEVVRASNRGRFEVLPLVNQNHMWVTQRDGDERDSHEAMDGKVVMVGNAFPISDPYNVDSRYPSSINERCYTVSTKQPVS